MMRGALVFLLVSPAADAQVAECPATYPAKASARLVAGAIRAGPANDRAELAGGEQRDIRGGYDLRYNFPKNEPKWLACMYGKRGALEWFKAMDQSTTDCVLHVRGRRLRTRIWLECR